jgi:hypothetical protein
LNEEERANAVFRATAVGSITLCSRAFGLGVDFRCFDSRIQKLGGLHVMQTFLSEDVSEEVQIQGRTARQGENGSYELILNASHLEKFFIIPGELARFLDDTKAMSKGRYDLLDFKRNEFFQRQWGTMSKAVATSDSLHEASVRFLGQLLEQDRDKALKFLKTRNASAVERVARVLFMFDATGSMSSLLNNTKAMICEVFSRVSKVLIDSGFGDACVCVKIVVYRNYNVDDSYLLQTSGWETHAENLRSFMAGISPAGGLGNEAIEVALWATPEMKFDQSEARTVD